MGANNNALEYISPRMTRRFTRLAWTAAAFTYLLIILGAIVRITGSGMGCGEHWPLCNGRLLPPLDLPTLIEYGHRLAAAAVSGLVAALAAYAWWLRRNARSGMRDASNGPSPPPAAVRLPSAPWGGGVRRANVARSSGGAGGGHSEAQPAALDRHPASRHRDAAARDAHRGGAGGPPDPGRPTDPGRQPGVQGTLEIPGLAPGVSGSGRPRARIPHRPVWRAHGEHRRGERLPRVPALQRPDRPHGELPAAHPLDAPAARLRALRVRRVVGRAHHEAWCVVRGCPCHAASRGRRRHGAARAPPGASGGARRGGRGGLGRTGPGGAVTQAGECYGEGKGEVEGKDVTPGTARPAAPADSPRDRRRPGTR